MNLNVGLTGQTVSGQQRQTERTRNPIPLNMILRKRTQTSNFSTATPFLPGISRAWWQEAQDLLRRGSTSGCRRTYVPWERKSFHSWMGPFMESLEYLANVPSIFPSVVRRNKKETSLNDSFKYTWCVAKWQRRFQNKSVRNDYSLIKEKGCI